jgi:hypothetical protein
MDDIVLTAQRFHTICGRALVICTHPWLCLGGIMVSFLINEKHPYHTERVCNDFNFIDRSPLVDFVAESPENWSRPRYCH